jgi:hypothetical protein
LDALAVRTLPESGPTPHYISVESECVGEGESDADNDPLGSLSALAERGYTKYKLVEQRSLRVLRPDESFYPRYDSLPFKIERELLRRLPFKWPDRDARARARVSRRHGHPFAYGSTGPYGPDLPGRWLDRPTAEQALLHHRSEYFATRHATPWGFWCDWHATH